MAARFAEMANVVMPSGTVAVAATAIVMTLAVVVALRPALTGFAVTANGVAWTANTSWSYVHVIEPEFGTVVAGVREIEYVVGVAPATRVLSVDVAGPLIVPAETPETQAARMATEVYFILS